jgi:conjugal transfer/entry exclusion protein
MGWYSDIARDISNIPKAIDHYENELIQARMECKIKGNVERAAAEMPGMVEQRFNQLQELEAILEYLNIELRRLRSSFFRKYLESYARALSSRDCEKYVDGESDVVDYEKIINEFALMRNKWVGGCKALDQNQWQLTNIVKLRVAGMEDASL